MKATTNNPVSFLATGLLTILLLTGCDRTAQDTSYSRNPEQKEANGYGTSEHDYQAWDECSKAHDHIRDTAPSANDLHQRLDGLSAQIQALRQTAEQIIARDNEHSQLSRELEQHKDSSTWETKSCSI